MNKTLYRFLVILFIACAGLPAGATNDREAPLSLDECLVLAKKNNNDLRIARDKVKEAEAVYHGKLGLLLPQVDANIGYFRYKEQLPAKKQRFGESLDDYYAELIMKLPLFQGGRDYGQIRASKSGLDAERRRLEQADRSVTISVTKAYYERVRSAASLEIQEELVKGLEEQTIIARLLYESGRISSIDVLKIETQAAAARDTLANLESIVRVRSLALGRAMGINSPIETSSGVEDIDAKIHIEKRCVADGFTSNPERMIAFHQLEKSRNDETIAEAGHYPYLSLLGNYNWEDKKFFPGNPNWNVGGAVTIPIFYGGRVAFAVAESKARTRQAEARFDDIVKDLAVRFETSAATAVDSFNRLATTRRVLSLAEEAYKTSLVRYKAGRLSSLDLLDAQTVWYNARLGYIKNIIDCRVAIAEIEQICPEALESQREGTK
ncbi:MAG: TolC family protein [Spirochaetota bacterium]